MILDLLIKEIKIMFKKLKNQIYLFRERKSGTYLWICQKCGEWHIGYSPLQIGKYKPKINGEYYRKHTCQYCNFIEIQKPTYYERMKKEGLIE